VWVFCVRLSHSVITLKKRVFFLQNTAPVKALFQAPEGKHTTGKSSTVTHMKQASKQDKAEQKDNMIGIDQGKINTLKPKAKQSGDDAIKQVSDQPRQASTSDAGKAPTELTKLTENNTHDAASMQDATTRGSLRDVDINQDKASSSVQNTTLLEENEEAKQGIPSQTGNVETQTTETTIAKRAVTFEVTTSPLAQPIKLSPKEWRAIHDEWLNSTMCAEIEDEALQGIPTMTGYCEGKWSTMANKKLAVVPTHGFVICYNLLIKMTSGENPL